MRGEVGGRLKQKRGQGRRTPEINWKNTMPLKVRSLASGLCLGSISFFAQAKRRTTDVTAAPTMTVLTIVS